MSNFFNTDGAALTSNKDDWETPQDLFDKLNETYHFGVDVASTHDNAKCDVHFTIEEDGLSQEWDGYGVVWCNPPYGRVSPKWIEKMAKEAAGGGPHLRTASGTHRHSRVSRLHLQEAKRADRVHPWPTQVRGQRRCRAERSVSVDACVLQLLT